MITIRQETPADNEAITEITQQAFENHPYSRQTEHFIIHALRAVGALTVSLVAQSDDGLVGHIAFSPVSLSDGTANWYGLGPVSVTPALQKQGIGSRLVTEGLAKLRAAGAAGCVLVGDPAFYRRFGFENPTGLAHEGVPPENLLTLSFDGPIPTGTVTFHPAFAATE